METKKQTKQECDRCGDEEQLEEMNGKMLCPECWDNDRCDSEHNSAH